MPRDGEIVTKSYNKNVVAVGTRLATTVTDTFMVLYLNEAEEYTAKTEV